MRDKDKFRVWCCNKNEYETHHIVCDTDGFLYHRGKRMPDNGSHIKENCTGKCDKNGKLIFEGDILYHQKMEDMDFSKDDEQFAVVEWSDLKSCWYGNMRTTCYDIPSCMFNQCEIICTIHDNPGAILAEREANNG